MDSFMKSEGWTHRRKRKSRNPYLRFDYEALAERPGAVFRDEDWKYIYIPYSEVIEL